VGQLAETSWIIYQCSEENLAVDSTLTDSLSKMTGVGYLDRFKNVDE
jgi:hypothetical protein